MRISINLATRPFVELRPLFARLRLAMAGFAAIAVGLGIGLHFMSARAQVQKAAMDSLVSQTEALRTERQKNEARMHEPQNRAVLERSEFLNALFASKSFSWTSVMMDLETVLPAGVQVTSIEPVITAEGEVNIRLRVSGDRDRAVELVRNLERSKRFLLPRLANETAQTQEPGKALTVAQSGTPGGVEFDIMSGYNPLPPSTKGSEQHDAGDKHKTEGAAQKPVVHKAAAGAKAAGVGASLPGKTGKPVGKPSGGTLVTGGAR